MSRSRGTVQASKRMRALIGTIAGHVGKNEYLDGILRVYAPKLGGRYWRKITMDQKMSYLFVQQQIVKDDPNADYHIGDEHFQNTVIGSCSKYVNQTSKILSADYMDCPKSEWPEKLIGMIGQTESAYSYGELIKTVAKYIPNPDMKEGNISRYKVNKEEGTIKPLPIPFNQQVFDDFSEFYGRIWQGVLIIEKMDGKEQEELLLHHLVHNTNIGYPFFKKQTVKNFKKYWRKFVWQFIGTPEDMDVPLTASEILQTVRSVMGKKLHLPYVLFYRTQGGRGKVKHRAVFGAHIVQKALAALLSAAKSIALVDGDGNKRITERGGLPIVAQIEWDEMFSRIKFLLPDIRDGNIIPMSEAEIKTKFGVTLPAGTYEVNFIGEDFPGYDQTIIYEDLEELTRIPGIGWLFRYVLDDLRYSEVWTGVRRLLKAFFKSGHPLTSDFGSYLHRKIHFNVQDWVRQKRFAVVLVSITLSDDSLMGNIGITSKCIAKYLERYGMKIKLEESHDYAQDHYVGFLKVDVGYMLRGGTKSFIGNPTSRYYKIAHSERQIEQDLKDLENWDADVRGVYKVTGNIEIDALVSKLASFGSEASSIVFGILKLIKDTALGKDAILAISHMKPKTEYELYRSDVPLGFNPAWLRTLPVQELLFEGSLQ